MLVWRSVLSLLTCLAVPGVSLAQTPISRALPAGVTVTRDLVYARYGERVLELDLYLPDPAGSHSTHPVIVVRGGNWRASEKEQFGPMAAALAARGVPAASIEYRPSSEAPFPAAVHDLKAAVRWLRANGAMYGLDPRAIGAIGGSAGGHLVSYLGVTSGIQELEGEGGWSNQSSPIQAVVALAGPSDLTAARSAPLDVREQFLAVPLERDSARWSFASPLSHVDSGAPRILLIQAENDGAVSPHESLKMATCYVEARVPVELLMFPEAPHTFWNFEEWFPDTMDRATTFFIRWLSAQPSGR